MPKLMLDLVVSAPAWRRAVKGLTPWARSIAAAAHDGAVADGAAALAGPVAIAFADDEAVRALNARFRGQDKPTNVLSFPAATPGGGDVILALETVAHEAAAQGKSVADHTAHLVTHGILHLMGYDHIQSGAARRMETLERRILDRFGIADPYARERSYAKP